MSAGKKSLSLEELRVRPGSPVPAASLPRAAIVILNLNGRHHLQGCFESLAKLDYPKDRLEVILIDNASDDGSIEEMRARHAWVRLAVNERNVGFSAGCNQGAELARGAEVVAFLNNDMRVEPRWLAELAAPIVRGEAQATTAKMLSWDGKRINSAGGGMNFHGIGLQLGLDEEPRAVFDVPRKTLFACGGAMAMDAEVFRALGGFDEEFFAYYEDVELGWRAWVLGHEVHYAPAAVCYHHHSSTSKRFPPETLRLLHVRNPLYACVKNYDDAHLRQFLPAILALAQRRAHLVSGLSDDGAFRIEKARPGEVGAPAPGGGPGWRSRLAARLIGEERVRKVELDLASEVPLRRLGAADLIGLQDLLGRWEHWMERRAAVQSRRRRADDEIFRLFLKPLWCVERDPAYQMLQRSLAQLCGIDRAFEGLAIDGHDPR